MTAFPLSRRGFLAASSAAAALVALPPAARSETQRISLVARTDATAPLVAPEGPPTAVWSYNGEVPGPLIRARQGDVLEAAFENRLDEPTTVHWHGLRIPIEMDGAPYISQAPTPPGGTFDYRFELKDAGVYWYHPHVNSSTQLGRGLRGAIIVDEPEAPEVERDVIWVIDDWRLDTEAQLMPFGQRHDGHHAGRIGNVITVNGSIAVEAPVRAGERIRLRLLNVANARSLKLRFETIDPWLMALDGHPVTARQLGGGSIKLGAGQRADLILDVALAPGETARVIDDAYGEANSFEMMRFVASAEPALRAAPPPAPESLPPNPVATPDLANARRHTLLLEGGAMRQLDGATRGHETLDLTAMMQAGLFWTMNGAVPAEHGMSAPLFDFTLGETQLIEIENRTAFEHPVHLHGHSFHVLGDGADPLAGAPIRDTVMVAPDHSAMIAFVADNPGDWMMHCHILEHQEAGMMGVARVA